MRYTLTSLKCLTSSRVTSPTSEVGKKARAAPGVEMSSAEPTQGIVAEHLPIAGEGVSNGFPSPAMGQGLLALYFSSDGDNKAESG